MCRYPSFFGSGDGPLSDFWTIKVPPIPTRPPSAKAMTPLRNCLYLTHDILQRPLGMLGWLERDISGQIICKIYLAVNGVGCFSTKGSNWSESRPQVQPVWVSSAQTGPPLSMVPKTNLISSYYYDVITPIY